jgi:hypothetical protein
MASSAWGEVRADVIDRLRALVPTFAPEQRWRHLDLARATSDAVGGRPREWRDRTQPGGDVAVAVHGSGEIQSERILVVRAHYTGGEDLDDWLEHDEDDLIAALEPRSTYPSGTWGALMVRRVEQRGQVEVLERGVVAVEWVVRCIYRRPATLA